MPILPRPITNCQQALDALQARFRAEQPEQALLRRQRAAEYRWEGTAGLRVLGHEVSPDYLDLVRLVFPGVEAEAAGFLLWEFTGFPSYWNIPADGATPGECCYAQLEALRREGPPEGEDEE